MHGTDASCRVLSADKVENILTMFYEKESARKFTTYCHDPFEQMVKPFKRMCNSACQNIKLACERKCETLHKRKYAHLPLLKCASLQSNFASPAKLTTFCESKPQILKHIIS